jgi:hypothetical protein
VRAPAKVEEAENAALASDTTKPEVADPAAIGPVSAGPLASQLLADRLVAGLARPDLDLGRRGPHGTEKFVAIWVPEDPGEPSEHWLVDLEKRVVSPATSAAQEDSAWDIVGSQKAWEQVMNGRQNLSVALRNYQLRYCDGDEADPLASEDRIGVLAALLALTVW